jgi:hypothetical protein
MNGKELNVAEKKAIWDMMYPNMNEEEIEDYCERLI